MHPLSGGFWAGPAQSKVVKMKKKNFTYWASSSPWGHVLSLKTFCRNPVLSWAIRYSVFQKVKSTSSLEFVCDDPFSTFWHLMVKFGYNNNLQIFVTYPSSLSLVNALLVSLSDNRIFFCWGSIFVSIISASSIKKKVDIITYYLWNALYSKTFTEN